MNETRNESTPELKPEPAPQSFKVGDRVTRTGRDVRVWEIEDINIADPSAGERSYAVLIRRHDTGGGRRVTAHLDELTPATPFLSEPQLPRGSVERYTALIRSLCTPSVVFRMAPDTAVLGLIGALVDPDSTIKDDAERVQLIRNVIKAGNIVAGRDEDDEDKG